LASWRDYAACQGMDTDIFFASENIGGPRRGRGLPGEKERAELAKKICTGCTVQEDCLEYALEYSLEHGIWAGYTPKERGKLSRRDVA